MGGQVVCSALVPPCGQHNMPAPKAATTEPVLQQWPPPRLDCVMLVLWARPRHAHHAVVAQQTGGNSPLRRSERVGHAGEANALAARRPSCELLLLGMTASVGALIQRRRGGQRHRRGRRLWGRHDAPGLVWIDCLGCSECQQARAKELRSFEPRLAQKLHPTRQSSALDGEKSWRWLRPMSGRVECRTSFFPDSQHDNAGEPNLPLDTPPNERMSKAPQGLPSGAAAAASTTPPPAGARRAAVMVTEQAGSRQGR